MTCEKNARSLPSGVHRPSFAGAASDRHDESSLHTFLLQMNWQMPLTSMCVLSQSSTEITSARAWRAECRSSLRRQESPPPAARMDTIHPAHGGVPQISSVASCGRSLTVSRCTFLQSGGAALTSRGAPPHLKGRISCSRAQIMPPGAGAIHISPTTYDSDWQVI